MDVMGLINRALALVARMPQRAVADNTLLACHEEFGRMWRAGNLDPLRPGDALDTYYCRRAALHAISPRMIEAELRPLLVAIERHDADQVRGLAKKLQGALDRIEPALELDPPMEAGVPLSRRPPSRWHEANHSDRRRGAKSKRDVLRQLPKHWDRQLWVATPKNWRHREALALHLFVPLRPEEMVPGLRPSRPSEGVLVKLNEAGYLAVSFAPVKSNQGLYGTERTTITVDAKIIGGPAVFLAERCSAAGGQFIISTHSKNAVRKALRLLGLRAFPELADTITPYVLRNQVIADLKVTFGGGAEVAAAAGHCTDRTQAHYGRVQHGRKRKGYLSITAARPPRCDNVERARQLSRAKGLRQKQ